MSGKHYRCPHLAEYGIDPIFDDATLGIEICKNCPEERECILERASTRRAEQQKAQTLERIKTVLQMKSEGKSMAVIATHLGVSVSTVGTYYGNRRRLPDYNDNGNH